MDLKKIASIANPTPTRPENSRVRARVKAFFMHLEKLLKAISRAFAGAILLFALAHFVPELREEMPNFYRIIDIFIDILEKLVSLAI